MSEITELTDHIVTGDQAVQLSITVTDDPGAGGANHRYEIGGFDTTSNPSRRDLLPSDNAVVLFQNGPIKEFGVNGVTHEVHLAILIHRMKSFQRGPFACADNQLALDHMRAALAALQNRTLNRIQRQVEGTHEK